MHTKCSFHSIFSWSLIENTCRLMLYLKENFDALGRDRVRERDRKKEMSLPTSRNKSWCPVYFLSLFLWWILGVYVIAALLQCSIQDMALSWDKDPLSRPHPFKLNTPYPWWMSVLATERQTYRERQRERCLCSSGPSLVTLVPVCWWLMQTDRHTNRQTDRQTEMSLLNRPLPSD